MFFSTRYFFLLEIFLCQVKGPTQESTNCPDMVIMVNAHTHILLPGAGEAMGKQKPLSTADGSVSWYSHSGRQYDNTHETKCACEL